MKFRLAFIFLALLASLLAGTALGSDHKEAPMVRESNPADIADLYAFVNPNNTEKLVLVMTVNPFSVREEGIAFLFSPHLRYKFLIDNDGDTLEDHVLSFDFNADQTFTAYLPGNRAVEGIGTMPTVEPVANDAVITETDDGIRLFAGPRDDPFFFDVVGFFRFLAGTGSFTGTDGFAGYNVSAIVAEIPIDMVMGDSTTLNIWATTERPFPPFKSHSQRGFSRQVDRVGNPAVATALIPAGLKDDFNQTPPDRDAAQFAPSIVASLQALGTDDENIGILASVAVPDVLTIDTMAPSGFPNGRTPYDDVIDTLLFFIFNQTEVSDGVDANEVAFLDSFPFLAAPHQPE